MPPFYKRLHRKKDGRELFLYGLMPLEGPPLPEDAEPTRLGMISYAVFCLKKKKMEKRCLYFLIVF